MKKLLENIKSAFSKLWGKLKTVTPKTWLISGISVGCAVLILVGCLVLIPGGDKPDTPAGPAGGEAVTVTVQNSLESPLKDVQVYVYEDDSLSELVTFAKTDGEGKVTSASTVGVWLEHKPYTKASGTSWITEISNNYTCSVDQIEAWTGFDFFHNLPDTIESATESNSSWSTFTAF